MATYDLEEQEQLDEIKTWWKMYGNLVTNIVTAAAVGVVAWQGWNWYQRNQTAQASMIFAVLQQGVQAGDSQRVKTASGELLEKFNGTSYASLGALSAAKAMIDAGDAKTAKAQLLWVAEKGKDELRDLARLRVAALMADDKEYEQALKQLDGSVSPGFEARFAESRGDVLAAQGRRGEAAEAYRQALAALPGDAGDGKSANPAPGWQGQTIAVYRDILQQKIDFLGESTP